MIFTKESDFELALIQQLSNHGWEAECIEYPTEEVLVKNWADIIYKNNCSPDKLDKYPLTDSEMNQILMQIKMLKSPAMINDWINGKVVTIKRDNQDDAMHLGKNVSLKIFDRNEIASGQSVYQIARQPQFKGLNDVSRDRRGDVMLLINGMPVIHIELKRSGIPVDFAINQIDLYNRRGLFSGLFALIQIFVAMTPEETVYFANPGNGEALKSEFQFHWADVNNEIIGDWTQIAGTLLAIPLAHELLGFYTIPDSSDGVLKVMRSYQYYAASRIADIVSKADWGYTSPLGGYIWHTTGSGKTMTSFKTAQIIASVGDADKIVFLVDRVELGTQSLQAYQGFADSATSVEGTESGTVLLKKLDSIEPKDMIIVSSIQKMNQLSKDDTRDDMLNRVKGKRLVFIFDECHRNTFGDMLRAIKETFPHALLFGFTGTPIFKDNAKKTLATADLFGDELHRYSISDGIRDKNVLGFDITSVPTYSDEDLRNAVALREVGANTVSDVMESPEKREAYYHFINDVPMVRDYEHGYTRGIEDYIENGHYDNDDHRRAVIEDIHGKWLVQSYKGLFHGILATHSISEAISYYRLFRRSAPNLKVVALFDPTVDGEMDPTTAVIKDEALEEILEDYNTYFNQKFTASSYASFKRDVCARLAHKLQYRSNDVEIDTDKYIDVVIVVKQLLTGFDSKYVNTLYVDKIMAYEEIVQAFSRTNRLYGPEKPFGSIRYYRKIHTMSRNIQDAFRLYSGSVPEGLYADKKDQNIRKMNVIVEDISDLFIAEGIEYYSKLPDNIASRHKFGRLFYQLRSLMEAIRLQMFTWQKNIDEKLGLNLDEETYNTLAVRYGELFSSSTPDGKSNPVIPFDITAKAHKQESIRIDADYMNKNFEKYIRAYNIDDFDSTLIDQLRMMLHKSFAQLSQEEQRAARQILVDIEHKRLVVDENKTLTDYINEYMNVDWNAKIQYCINLLGVDEAKLRALLNAHVNETNIDEYGRFNELISTVDIERAKQNLGIVDQPHWKCIIKIKNILREFVIYNKLDGYQS